MSKKPLMVGPTGRAQKRILHDFKDIQRDPSQYFTAAPRDDNLFEWVCLLYFKLYFSVIVYCSFMTSQLQ